MMRPVGARWLFVFWSAKLLANSILARTKPLIYAAASFGAVRLDQWWTLGSALGSAVRLTPRELAVLRLISFGKSLPDIAKLLGLGPETVRTHSKNAQAKLGTRNQAQAVAEAMRRHMIA